MPSTIFPLINRQFRLSSRPVGMPKESDFDLVASPLYKPQDGEVLARAVYLSVDPYMRAKIGSAKAYTDPVQVGDVMVGLAIGQIMESHRSEFDTGDFVLAEWGWREYAVSDGRAWLKLQTQSLPVSTKLGVLGLTGISGYFGLLEICQPKSGETLVVSGAAGAVGTIVGQVGKIKGCRVIGIAGTDRKVDYLVNELGFDGAINYKAGGDLGDKLAALCPDGIHCYFDNVGGTISDAVFPLMNSFGRVSICGLISEYGHDKPQFGSRLLESILAKQLHVEGFLLTRFQSRWSEALEQLNEWLNEGKLQYREEIVEGFENLPRAFIGMLKGENIGKMLVKA